MEYDRVADLPLTIDEVALERRERDTSSDFTRVTTVVSLSGPAGDGSDAAAGATGSGANTSSSSTGTTGPSTDARGRAGTTGRGEDVTYEADEHDALAETELPDLTGEYTVDSFSDRLAEADLFPAGAPDRRVFRNYRRWGFESAALDLALAQAGTDLASALDRRYDPLRFVVSTRLGAPPTVDRVEALLAGDPDLAFKLDPTPDWNDDLVAELADTGAVATLDLKGQYEGTEVDAAPDPELYRRVVEAFPDAVIEDPRLTDETRPVFDDPAVRERVSWDAPIHGVADVEALPWEPSWLNLKPSRFGSIESLFETIEYCRERGIETYGGGQFELDVGRGQIQALASLCYPDSPNDVAPGGYNAPRIVEGLPSSPLSPPTDPVGFRWS